MFLQPNALICALTLFRAARAYMSEARRDPLMILGLREARARSAAFQQYRSRHGTALAFFYTSPGYFREKLQASRAQEEVERLLPTFATNYVDAHRAPTKAGGRFHPAKNNS
jgi:hypothetical protein